MMRQYTLILFLVSSHVFAEPIYEPSKNKIDIKEFPNNNINYFFSNNNAESWRLVYAKLKSPSDDFSYKSHCRTNEGGSDKVLSFDISNIIKNTGDSFNADNIHSYYDGDSGRKALALLLGETKIKKSIISITKALVRRGDSRYAKLTPAKLKKKLSLLNDNDVNIMTVCFGYLQQLIATPIFEDIESSTDLEVDPRKIVFWYDGSKAKANPNSNSNSNSTVKSNK